MFHFLGKEAPSLVYPWFKLFSVTGHHLNSQLVKTYTGKQSLSKGTNKVAIEKLKINSKAQK
jgi:hypothetical protein